MSEERRKVETFYGGKLRLRICGLLQRNDGALLCALHHGVGELNRLWVPPGGGLDFGEKLDDCLRREFLEETGLDISVGSLHSVHEFVRPPLHAVELFYHVTASSTQVPVLGTDPEWPSDLPPVISELAWVLPGDIADPRLYHAVVREVLLTR